MADLCAYCELDTGGNHRADCPCHPDNMDRPKEEPPLGWVCPVCRRGVAPWIHVCPCTVLERKFSASASSLNLGDPPYIPPTAIGPKR